MKKIFLAAALIAFAPTAKAADPITLKLAFPVPPVSFLNREVLMPWSQEIEAATDGAVKIQIFYGPTLASLSNVYDRVLNGVADIGWGLHGPFGTQFPKTSVATIPGILSTGPQCSTALWQLVAKDVIADEYTQVKPLMLMCFAHTMFIASKPLRTIADLRGMKVGAGSKMQADTITLLRGGPVTLLSVEVYPSLQRGIIEAAATGWAAVTVFKLFEVTKHALDVPLGNPTMFLLMNKDSYAKLPDEARRAVDSKSGASLARRMGEAGESETKHGREVVEKTPGYTITTMPKSEVAQLQQLMQPLVDEWVKATPDGARVLSSFKAELEKAD